MNKKISTLIAALCLVGALVVPTEELSARTKSQASEPLFTHAVQTLEAVRQHFKTDDKSLLQEAIPVQPNQNAYSYLWGYSAMFSSSCALYEASGDKKWLKFVDKTMMRGLDRDYDDRRKPAAYASYVNDAPESDRFYDDNIWVGIDMADLYLATKNSKYLERAEEVWRFIESGTDGELGDGIYWCEQKKGSKNTCSNAPGSVLALKLYKATGNERYLERGMALYKWTREHLMDPVDHLFFDNVSLNGRVEKTKFSYNTGQMIQSAALLYDITGERRYLTEAETMAESAYHRFFDDIGRADGVRLLRGGELWFDAVMLRGYIELYHINADRTYLNAFLATMNMAWDTRYSRDERGLFGPHYDMRGKNRSKTLLNQAAMIEMMARLSAVCPDTAEGE